MTLLTGKSANLFLQNMKEAEAKKLSPEEKKQLEESYHKMKSIIAKSNG